MANNINNTLVARVHPKSNTSCCRNTTSCCRKTTIPVWCVKHSVSKPLISITHQECSSFRILLQFASNNSSTRLRFNRLLNARGQLPLNDDLVLSTSDFTVDVQQANDDSDEKQHVDEHYWFKDFENNEMEHTHLYNILIQHNTCKEFSFHCCLSISFVL